MVKISVIQCTKRKIPHLEWALESLMKQTLPHENFEYIIVDGLYEIREDEVRKLIDDKTKELGIDFPIMYLKDKASRWKGKRPALCNARNTGIIFANGQYIVHHDDNCKMSPNWLEKHISWLEKGYITAGSWISYKDVSKEPYHGWEYRSGILKEPAEISGGWLYGINFGYPICVALDVNGFDEYMDGEMGQDDIDFGIRAQRKGYKIMYDPSCYVECYYADHGSFHYYFSNRATDIPGIKKEIGFDIPPVNIKLKDGLLHFSNEFAMQELLEDTQRSWTKGNTIQIKGTREIFGTGNGTSNWKYSIEELYEKLRSFIDGNPVDWRDGKLIEEKLKYESK